MPLMMAMIEQCNSTEAMLMCNFTLAKAFAVIFSILVTLSVVACIMLEYW